LIAVCRCEARRKGGLGCGVQFYRSPLSFISSPGCLGLDERKKKEDRENRAPYWLLLG